MPIGDWVSVNWFSLRLQCHVWSGEVPRERVIYFNFWLSIYWFICWKFRLLVIYSMYCVFRVIFCKLQAGFLRLLNAAKYAGKRLYSFADFYMHCFLFLSVSSLNLHARLVSIITLNPKMTEGKTWEEIICTQNFLFPCISVSHRCPHTHSLPLPWSLVQLDFFYNL